ncbi:hypothetical protein HD597_001747 [Nonomuraea thailandensis]|uniref:Uncharacterized protein n=1 Tax=Nonomuraea thailandensis TaxID=1188745 RepID=A0A9X2JYZ6_9ACTN|nr:hypothetical protein [Nonomuraea thailandensis]MCP2354727.1 hypothetical protein [Nonomuraea thailandensis]
MSDTPPEPGPQDPDGPDPAGRGAPDPAGALDQDALAPPRPPDGFEPV